jgi:hypothetical protein
MDSAVLLPVAFPPSKAAFLVAGLAIWLLLYSYNAYWLHRSHASKESGQLPPKVPYLVPYLDGIGLFTWRFGTPSFGKAFQRLS